MKCRNSSWTSLVSVWWFVLSSIQGLDFATHIGCFKSNLKEFHNQFVSNYDLLEGIPTPELCMNDCKSKGFKYAGHHSSFNCLCSNSRPHFDVSPNISDCYYRCDGNVNGICGSPDRVNVYELYDEISDETEQNYIGCFLDGGTRERILATENMIKQKFITPESCIRFCNIKGYKYAGITYRFLCSCDNQLGTKKNEKLCSKNSNDDKHLIAVGKMYMRLYYTNLSGNMVLQETGLLLLASYCYKQASFSNKPKCINY